MNDKTNRALLDFLDGSPTAFQAIENMSKLLAESGYTQLRESEAWTLEKGRGYFVTRNGSALIAFRIPEGDCGGFNIMASHSDSPALKLKNSAETDAAGQYVKLNVEKYGGMICSSWFDRPLSVAGRLLLRTEDGVRSVPVNIDRDLMIIPSIAIHMNRLTNEGWKISVQKDMMPLYAQKSEEPDGVAALAAEEVGAEADDVIDADLFLYNRMRGTVLGADGEFIASGRLDDLQCVFSSLQGFLGAEVSDRIAVHCVYDNEEVGSGTRQGAASTFLKDTIARIEEKLGFSEEQRQRALSNSFLLSADNAHSVHPNYAEKADISNRPTMNNGIVIKYSANQKYTTDAVSGGICRLLCEKAGVPYQVFHNHSDVQGGSTLGNISTSQLPICSADIGLAQLAMHSSYETAGALDTEYLIRLAQTFFSSGISAEGDGKISVG